MLHQNFSTIIFICLSRFLTGVKQRQRSPFIPAADLVYCMKNENSQAFPRHWALLADNVQVQYKS